MKMKRLAMIAASAAALAACETPMGPAEPGGPPPPAYQGLPAATAFSAADFGWSAGGGAGALNGQLALKRGPERYTCQGEDVLLIPETAWSRRRMIILYGSAAQAAVPVSIVRARQPSAPTGDYARFVRHTTCDADNRFAFAGLPAGPWFVVTLGRSVGGQGEPVAVIRRIDVGPGLRTVTLY